MRRGCPMASRIPSRRRVPPRLFAAQGMVLGRDIASPVVGLPQGHRIKTILSQKQVQVSNEKGVPPSSTSQPSTPRKVGRRGDTCVARLCYRKFLRMERGRATGSPVLIGPYHRADMSQDLLALTEVREIWRVCLVRPDHLLAIPMRQLVYSSVRHHSVARKLASHENLQCSIHRAGTSRVRAD